MTVDEMLSIVKSAPKADKATTIIKILQGEYNEQARSTKNGVSQQKVEDLYKRMKGKVTCMFLVAYQEGIIGQLIGFPVKKQKDGDYLFEMILKISMREAPDTFEHLKELGLIEYL